jgi:hypothetical protein
MTWEMASEMSLSGHVDIGGHTHTHPILARCDVMAMRAKLPPAVIAFMPRSVNCLLLLPIPMAGLTISPAKHSCLA